MQPLGMIWVIDYSQAIVTTIAETPYHKGSPLVLPTIELTHWPALHGTDQHGPRSTTHTPIFLGADRHV